MNYLHYTRHLFSAQWERGKIPAYTILIKSKHTMSQTYTGTYFHEKLIRRFLNSTNQPSQHSMEVNRSFPAIWQDNQPPLSRHSSTVLNVQRDQPTCTLDHTSLSKPPTIDNEYYVTGMGNSNLTNETMHVESIKCHSSSVLGDCVYNCILYFLE